MTVRDRDTTEQVRVPIDELVDDLVGRFASRWSGRDPSARSPSSTTSSDPSPPPELDEFLGPLEGLDVLDVAAGTGLVTRFLDRAALGSPRSSPTRRCAPSWSGVRRTRGS